MKVLVTGATGLIGTELCQSFDDRVEVVAGGRQSTPPLDLADKDGISVWLDSVKPECIVHLAAFTDVSGAHQQQGDTAGECYRLNVDATAAIAQWCADNDSHLVHVSTDFVFSGAKDIRLDETSECSPIEWYGETKKIAEERVIAGCEKWTIARIAFPISMQQKARPNFCHTISQRLLKGDELKLFNDQIITPTSIADIANGLVALVDNRPVGEVFHLTGSKAYSPYELGMLIAEHEHVNPDLIEPSSLVEYLKIDPRPRQQYLRIDNRKWQSFCQEQGLDFPLSAANVIETGV